MSFRPIFALLPALALAACTAQQAVTHAESKPNVDLRSYHTYQFQDDAARRDTTLRYSEANLLDLKQSVAGQLAARGLRPATEHPDLLVNLTLTVEQRTQTRPAYYKTDGAPFYIGQRNFHWEAGDIPVGTYRAGTATIDLVDATRKELVWQGTTTAVLPRQPDRASQQVAAAVAEVFKQYPVPAR